MGTALNTGVQARTFEDFEVLRARRLRGPLWFFPMARHGGKACSSFGWAKGGAVVCNLLAIMCRLLLWNQSGMASIEQTEQHVLHGTYTENIAHVAPRRVF